MQPPLAWYSREGARREIPRGEGCDVTPATLNMLAPRITEVVMAFVHPEYLVETDWLEQNLGDPSLRILDCTVFLRRPEGDAGAGRPAWRTESGLARWSEGHIPGSAFADLAGDLSDPSSKLPFTMPPPSQFEAAMSRLGVGPGTRVVCYDGNLSMWAARVWWMLRAFGFDNAAVLNGGWRKWTREGRPVSKAAVAYPPGKFAGRPRPELIATRDDVLGAIGDGATCIVDALTESQFQGSHPSPYGRPGHITSAVNVSAVAMLEPETHAYLPADELRERFTAVGSTTAEGVITYCGGGIAASSDAFILTLLGHERVAVYDGSLSEWAHDPSLPMEAG